MNKKESQLRHDYDACRIQRLKLETIFDSVSDGLIAIDTENQINNFNKAAERITGWSFEEAGGNNISSILNINNPRDKSVVKTAISSHEALDKHDVEIITKQGEVKQVVLHIDVLDDSAEQFEGIVLILHDVSEVKRLHREVQGRYKFGNLIGKSPQMQSIYELIRQAGTSDASILIEGKSGTGKELVAKAIHYNSSRSTHPFITVNCSAIPETLLESELFGHVKGAFTGALYDRAGRFESADGGTIFLDEIGELSLGAQVKLLRVVQEKTFERVGSSKLQHVDVRIISATNKHLKSLMESKDFREDLYYRLRVFPINLPPLCERKEDIPLLVQHFLDRNNDKMGKNIKKVEAKALGALLDYNWPGNIRELENALEYAFARVEGGEIRLNDLPAEVLSVSGLSFVKGEYELGSSTTPDEEKEMIESALRDAKRNKSKAAKLLAIGRTTLYKKMKAHNIS